MAEPNGIVIGGDLYRVINSFSFVNNRYEFRELKGGYSISFDQRYSVYHALSKNNNNNNTSGIDIDSINQLFTSKNTSKIKVIQAKQQSQSLDESQYSLYLQISLIC
jgi:hypothetical protein